MLRFFASFGSSKKLSVLKSQASNRVTVDAVVAGKTMYESMSSVTQSASNAAAIKKAGTESAADPAKEAAEKARRSLLPPYDMGAKKPRDIYSAKKVR